MSEDNNSHENANVSRTDEDRDRSLSHHARDGIRGRFGSISRRQFLGVTAGSIAFTGSVSAQDSGDWQEVTDANWGYEATQLKKYHERFSDRRGEGVDIAIIDSGFDTGHHLFNPIEQEEDRLDYRINIDMNTSRCISPLGDCEGIDDPTGHGTAVTGVIWQAAPHATYSIIRQPSPSSDEIDIKPSDYFNDTLTGPPKAILKRISELITVEYYENTIREVMEEVDPDIINISNSGYIINDLFDWIDIYDRGIDDVFDDKYWVSFTFDQLNEAYNTAAQTAVIVSSTGQEQIREEGENQPAPFPLPPSTADDVLSVSSIKKLGPDSFGIYENGAPDYTRDGKPDVAAPGHDIHSIIDNPNSSVTDSWYGSSFASPHVAGVAALLSDYGEPDEIRKAILNSTYPVLNDPKDLSGEGAVRIMGAYNRLLGGSTLTVDVVNNITETPVVGATVTVNGEQKETDDGGEAYFDLEDGTYTVTVAYEGFEDIEEEVTIEGEDQRVLMAFDEQDETGESSITVRLIDAETGEPIPDGTVTLMYFERADDPFGPKSTDDDGVATYDGIDAEHPRRSGEYGVRGRAAGYGEEEENFTLEENRSVEITLELEPEEKVKRSTLTVSVIDAETGAPVETLPNVYVNHDGERIETARANDRGRAQISLEDGREYTVSAMDEIPRSSEERTVTLDGDTEITLELNGEENTKTVWVPDPDSDSCSRMTVPADAHPDPAFETEEACLEYNGGFGEGNGDTTEETPSADDADEG